MLKLSFKKLTWEFFSLCVHEILRGLFTQKVESSDSPMNKPVYIILNITTFFSFKEKKVKVPQHKVLISSNFLFFRLSENQSFVMLNMFSYLRLFQQFSLTILKSSLAIDDKCSFWLVSYWTLFALQPFFHLPRKIGAES